MIDLFGYIRYDRNELKLKEYRLLRAYYCGLCHALGRVAPVLKLKLSYDITFLSLCLACVKNETPQIKKTFCPNHPMQKTLYAVSPSVSMAADLSVLLAMFKLKDDAKDGETARALIGGGLIKSAYKKVKARNPALHACLTQTLAAFYAAEEEKQDAESLAVLFGQVLFNIIPHLDVAEKYVPVLQQMAANLGQWVYLADAADDWEADKRKGRFNPLTEPPSYYAAGQSYRLMQAKQACQLLPDNAFTPLIDNFLTYGMYAAQNQYFREKENHHGNSSKKAQ